MKAGFAMGAGAEIGKRIAQATRHPTAAKILQGVANSKMPAPRLGAAAVGAGAAVVGTVGLPVAVAAAGGLFAAYKGLKWLSEQ